MNEWKESQSNDMLPKQCQHITDIILDGEKLQEIFYVSRTITEEGEKIKPFP